MANNKSATIQPGNKQVKILEKISDADRISKLPEPILHHILSFLSTKQAATASVLSRSWQYHWTWVPNLYISEWEIRLKDMSFDQILLKIFLSRRARCITKLRLSISSSESNCDLISFLSILCAAVERNVEELDLYTSVSFELCTRLLCCKTLVVLTLRGEIMIDIGSSHVHLPSLKVLHLSMVKYKDEYTFCSLFPACPVLDYIVVRFDASVHRSNDFHYEIPSLSVRHVALLQYCTNPYVPSKITVRAPALEHFTVDFFPTVLVLNNVSSSVHATFNISLFRMRLRDTYWDTMNVIFGALRNVQFLELSLGYCKVQSDHNIIPLPIFPGFDNLSELKLFSYCCPLPLLLNMLSNCPRLEHLTIVSKRRCSCRNPGCWISPQLQVPSCLTFHLATIKFEGFEGFEDEIEFSEYALSNCKVLRSMTIRYENNRNLERKFGAFKKISGFVKQATRCQLTFQPQF